MTDKRRRNAAIAMASMFKEGRAVEILRSLIEAPPVSSTSTQIADDHFHMALCLYKIEAGINDLESSISLAERILRVRPYLEKALDLNPAHERAALLMKKLVALTEDSAADARAVFNAIAAENAPQPEIIEPFLQEQGPNEILAVDKVCFTEQPTLGL